jgi:hypothetical protein
MSGNMEGMIMDDDDDDDDSYNNSLEAGIGDDASSGTISTGKSGEQCQLSPISVLQCLRPLILQGAESPRSSSHETVDGKNHPHHRHHHHGMYALLLRHLCRVFCAEPIDRTIGYQLFPYTSVRNETESIS